MGKCNHNNTAAPANYVPDGDTPPEALAPDDVSSSMFGGKGRRRSRRMRTRHSKSRRRQKSSRRSKSRRRSRRR